MFRAQLVDLKGRSLLVLYPSLFFGEPSRALLWIKSQAKTSLEKISELFRQGNKPKGEPSFMHLVYDDGPKTLLFVGITYIMQNLFIDKYK